MSEYTKQAEKFLADTKTTFSARLLYTGPYFDDDKEYRDVYEITLTRGGRKPWVFRFGQSIAKTGKGAPTAYDALACVTKSDPGTFEDFCAEYGYDSDSRKAEKTYFAAQKEWAECNRVFGDVVEQLQEIN